MKLYPRVVIVGAGFGGLQTACSLAKQNVEVILIDRHNYHTFIPLLYQVATAQLAPEQVAVPIRTLLRKGDNLSFLQAEVESIDFGAKEVKTNLHSINYDYLVLATGSKSNFFNIPGAEKHSFGLKTLNQAVELRNRLLSCFEAANCVSDPIRRQQLLTIAIVGGGATGVELAGSLVELINHSLKRDFPDLNPQEIQLLLIQKSDRLFPEFPASLDNYTAKKLRRLGVKVMLESQVIAVNANSLELDDATLIATSTVIWAVGVSGAIPKCFPSSAVGKQKQIRVASTLQLRDYPEVFAIGDLASTPHQLLSGVAPEALQQGVYTASAIVKQIQGQPLKPFSYLNKGRLAIVGCYSGIGQIAGVHATYALLSLRILLVLIFLYHGAPKAIFWQKAMEKFVGFGLPGFLGPITGIAEVVAAVPLLFGRFWKVTNLILIFIISGALVTVQIPNFLADSSKVAGLERDLLILVGHIVLLACNPNGKLSINKQDEVEPVRAR